EGYFQAEPLFSVRVIQRLRNGIEVLRKEDWPPVFSFIYDEFWLATRGPSLAGLLSTALGPEHRQIPHLWTFYIPPTRGATGWLPHVDGWEKSDGSGDRSNRLTVWIPLSEATLENGCMYVIPKHLL